MFENILKLEMNVTIFKSINYFILFSLKQKILLETILILLSSNFGIFLFLHDALFMTVFEKEKNSPISFFLYYYIFHIFIRREKGFHFFLLIKRKYNCYI